MDLGREELEDSFLDVEAIERGGRQPDISDHKQALEAARVQAEEELSGGAPNVTPVYLSIQNPLVVGSPPDVANQVPAPETIFTFDYGYSFTLRCIILIDYYVYNDCNTIAPQ